MEYILQCLFLAGLQDKFIVDITKSGKKSLDEMVEVVKQTEKAANNEDCDHPVCARGIKTIGTASHEDGTDSDDSSNEPRSRRRAEQVRHAGEAGENHGNAKLEDLLFLLFWEEPHNEGMQGLDSG